VSEKKDWAGTLQTWELITNPDKQIELLRDVMGMAPITYKDVKCIHCDTVFKAQFIGRKKVQHICSRGHSEVL
jgi:hypothetical protein